MTTATERILAQVNDLPTLPDVVARLSVLISNDVWSAADFEEIVEPDPALTANLLRLANSPYFGFSRKITSVRQAVTLMGIKRVFEVAASGAFSRVIPTHIHGYDMTAQAFWRHCIAVAILSEKLVAELGINMPSLTFTSGLLHDMGKLVIGTNLAQDETQLATLLSDGHTPFIDAERQVLGTDHCEIGSAVSRKWNLPEVVEVAARWHHDPDHTPNNSNRVLVDLVHVADGLAHTLGLGSDCGGLARVVQPSVIERLMITTRGLERVACDSMEQISSMGNFLLGGGK